MEFLKEDFIKNIIPKKRYKFYGNNFLELKKNNFRTTFFCNFNLYKEFIQINLYSFYVNFAFRNIFYKGAKNFIILSYGETQTLICR